MTALVGFGVAGSADAAEILVNADIAVSTTWTANNTYNLQKQIYVLPGATLTIEPGTIIASTTGLGGSLAVTRGAQIFALGSADQPIIMTSKADVATWNGGDPKSGVWREAANEWGNLALMGRGYISENATPGNVPTPNASNVATLEGLVAAFPGDPNVLYGGGDDNDDSGTVQYVSIRYGGKVVALNVELNGLAMGGIGRATDIHHIDIMNGVDDGIEIWGGTVNVKYFNIWNVGDDSFDIDQGWRGKAQFGLIVQGYSANASQGSGVGDNCFELDGAEDSDWQPVTTTVFYNCTVIGQPVDGDQGTAWRDNARVQFRNCIFMDVGEEVVKFDNIDGDGGHGYAFNGTLTWPQTWTTDYTQTSLINAPPNPAAFYMAQTSGKLAEIKDSVFFRNQFATAYTEANARGVFDPANNNVLIPGFDPVDAPITGMTRAGPVVKGGKTMLRVTALDPRPANEALVSVAAAPNDGFFTSAQYRGAFQPFEEGGTWLAGWTASEAFGFTPQVGNTLTESFCTAKAGLFCGPPAIVAGGTASATAGSGFTITAGPARSCRSGILVYSNSASNPVAGLPFEGGTLCIDPMGLRRAGSTNSGGTVGNQNCNGQFSIDMNAFAVGAWIVPNCDGTPSATPPNNPAGFLGVPGTTVHAQWWGRDSIPTGSFVSDGIAWTIGP